MRCQMIRSYSEKVKLFATEGGGVLFTYVKLILLVQVAQNLDCDKGDCRQPDQSVMPEISVVKV